MEKLLLKNFIKLSMLHRLTVKRITTDDGLYIGHFPILHYVYKNRRCSQREIANILKVSPASVATSVKRLQKQGILVKIQDEEDLRYNKIDITNVGIDLLKRNHQKIREAEEKIFDGISEEMKNNFNECVNIMINNLMKDIEKDKSTCAMMENLKIMDENDDKKIIYNKHKGDKNA